LGTIHLGCKKSYVSADSSFYLNKLMFSFFRTKIITFFVTKQLCFIVQIIHQASSSRAWCSVAQKHRFLSGGAALFATEPLQPSKHSFYLSQIGVSDETYRFASVKHTPGTPLRASGANPLFIDFQKLRIMFSILLLFSLFSKLCSTVE
jgi:hypothetical protein